MICPRCQRRFEGDHLFCPHDGEQLVAALDIRRLRSKPTEHHGTVFGGRYQVRGLIGAGAMAKVFLALDQRAGVPVALKVLEARHIGDKRLVARFIREAKAAAEVTHRSIVEMLDVGLADDGSPYLVMEYLFGETLGDWLRREKTMPVAQGLPFMRQVADALAVVHRAGIVHRDVKPDNVFLLGEKRDPYAAKLVDFGYAKPSQEGNLTQAGVAVGTVAYMAPEQAVSDRVDARTDVYGFGVLMYRTFGGRVPFGGAEASDVLARHLGEEPPPLGLAGGSGADGALAAGIELIVRKTMRKRPEHRYASMEALLGDLARLERGEALSARVPPDGPDVYVPSEPFAQQAVAFLQKKLGK